MSIFSWLEEQRKFKISLVNRFNPTIDSIKTRDLWTRCDQCGVILHVKNLKENQRVCFSCGFHLQINSQERLEDLLDVNTWHSLDELISPCDPLNFYDSHSYKNRLEEFQKRTGLQDAIQTGTGLINGIPVAIGVMDFYFLGGTLGSVVGEKITRLIEYAMQEGLILILICSSGGVRIQEGSVSLMQMAKITSSLHFYQSHANLLYISILTSPTTGGVTASFAMLGDLIIAEPKALISFAGRRAIKTQSYEQLPEQFQTAEYLYSNGLIDLIVSRVLIKQALSELFSFYKEAPRKKKGKFIKYLPKAFSILIDEKVNRYLEE